MSEHPYVVYAWDGHSSYRIVMCPDESHRVVHNRGELDELAREQGIDLADPDQVVWEGGDRWPQRNGPQKG